MSKVIIDIGHHNNDTGACANGLREVDLNVQVAKECVAQLKRHGVQVITTSGTLQNRVNIEHKEQPSLFVSIHNNAGCGDGSEVLVYSKSDPQLTLAKNIEAQLINLNNSRGIKERKDLFVLSKTQCPACLVECAFIDSKDVECIDELQEQKAFGKAIAKGILKTLKIEYKEEAGKQDVLYRVCVGAYKKKENALKAQQQAKEKGFNNAYIQEVKKNG